MRIARTREYDRVFSARKSAADANLVVYARPNDLAFARLGVIAGKKVGRAVTRNRVKRLVREAFRTSREDLRDGFDYVVVVRKGASAARFADIKTAFVRLAERAGAKWEK